MGPRKGGEDELSSPRVSRVNSEVVALRDGIDDIVEVGEVELRGNALGVKVEGEGDDVDVAGALAVPEEAALDAVGSGHEAEFGGGDSGSSVVVGVEGDDTAVTVGDVLAEVLDLRKAEAVSFPRCAI